jgi:hypothetical protein
MVPVQFSPGVKHVVTAEGTVVVLGDGAGDRDPAVLRPHWAKGTR